MRKTICCLLGCLSIALPIAVGLSLKPSAEVVAAASGDLVFEETTIKTDVDVSGDGIDGGKQYYLAWTGLPIVSSDAETKNFSVEYDGEPHAPSAALKCEEEGDFFRETTISVSRVDGSESESIFAINVGKYKATAACADTQITITSGNEIEFEIKKAPREVIWAQEESYTYSGEAQGPKASFINIANEAVSLAATGIGVNAGLHTASVTADAAGDNYTLTNLECTYTIDPKSEEVIWDKGVEDGSYTYDGELHGPTAKYQNVNGEEIALSVSGLKVNAGENYTASVASDTAGSNYVLTNLECSYKILPMSVDVTWGEETQFTYNGLRQGPTASFTMGSETVSLPVEGLEIDANEDSYTATVLPTAAGNNYVLTNLLCPYTILALSVAVQWDTAESYTYNGKTQGPTASYINVAGEKITLTINDLGAEVGQYTARVTSDAAGDNYTLTNLACDYVITKLRTTIFWVTFNFIANGEIQKPRAFAVGPSGEIVELPVNAEGVKVGEYDASIDTSKTDANWELDGELSISYKIMPQVKFGTGGTAVSVVFGVLLFFGAVAAISYWFFVRKKQNEQAATEISRLSDEKQIIELQNATLRSDCTRLQIDIEGLREKTEKQLSEIDVLKASLVRLQADLKHTEEMLEGERANPHNQELAQEAATLRASSERLQAELDHVQAELKAAKQKLQTESADKERLEGKVKTLSEENEKLKQKKSPSRFSGFPIEDYFPKIDAAFERADSSEYNEHDPRGSFIIQRQQLNEIRKWLNAYRAQR